MACGDTTFELFDVHIDNNDNDCDLNAAADDDDYVDDNDDDEDDDDGDDDADDHDAADDDDDDDYEDDDDDDDDSAGSNMYHQEGWKQLLYGKLILACKGCTQIQSCDGVNVDLGSVGSSICVLLSADIWWPWPLAPIDAILAYKDTPIGSCCMREVLFEKMTIPQTAKASAGRAFGCSTTFSSTVSIHQRSLGCWPGSGATWRVWNGWNS